MRKKFLATMMTTAMVASLAGCGASSSNTANNTGSNDSASNAGTTENTSTDASADATESSNGGTIVIGDQTETSGDLFPYWTNNASDYSVDKMIEGYEVVSLNKKGEYEYNSTVLAEDPTETENEDGSKTWTFKIKDDLKWSNGDPITAKDYVFYYLFLGSNEVETDLGAGNAVFFMQYIKGYNEYVAGETDAFSGVHYIDDSTFSLTVDSQFLPYFYGNALVAALPMYMAGWVPSDITIEDTEDGAKFSDNFTSDYISETVNAFRYNPTACAGAYEFVSYDDSSYSYTLKKNPNFAGNYEGQTANIDTVIYRYVAEDTMLDQLKTGAIDLLLQVAGGDEIDQGLDMVDEGGFDYMSFPRNGYGKIAFKCNQGPTQFQEVRQAVAYLLDRQAFAQTFTGGHGTVVNGPYGSAQWMVQEAEDQIDTLNTYSYSLDSAKKVLEDGGWVYNEDGSDYAGTGIRYKQLDDGTYMPLIIEWFTSENNAVSDLLVTSLQQNPDVATAGMQINQTSGSFDELIQYYYTNDPDACPYQMFNLGDGFSIPYDVKDQYEIDGSSNYDCINDDTLYNYAVAMNQTPEGDNEKYLENWFGFMQRWNELLPDIPLYSNDYHDFYSTKVQNYEEDGAGWDVSQAILYTTVTE